MWKRIESGTSGKFLGADYVLWVKDKARYFAINGIVSLQADGSIKVIAEGEEHDLNRFVEKLRRGSFFSHIENFYVKWHEPRGEFKDFFIL